MSQWEYCYVHQSVTPVEGGGLVSDYFIARPDSPETRNDLKENQVLAILGEEGWELVSVLGVQTQYADRPAEMGGIPSRSARQGSSDISSTMYYFKRPKQPAV